MQFINIVVHSVEDMNFRVHLQYEFTKLGLDDFLEVRSLSSKQNSLFKYIIFDTLLSPSHFFRYRHILKIKTESFLQSKPSESIFGYVPLVIMLFCNPGVSVLAEIQAHRER